MFSISCLHITPVMASNGRCSSSSGFPNCLCALAITVLCQLPHNYYFLKKTHSRLTLSATPEDYRFTTHFSLVKLPAHNLLAWTAQKTPLLKVFYFRKHDCYGDSPAMAVHICLLSSHCLTPSVCHNM